MIKLILIILMVLPTSYAICQEDLLKELEEGAEPAKQYASSAFKSTRIINTHSVETLGKNQLDFRISHRFGRINSGAYDLFGLDQSTIRLALEYGIKDGINVGLGRSSFNKTYDGFLKFRLLRQRTDHQWKAPFTISWFSSMGLNTLKTLDTYINENTSGRISYVHQLLVARKFNEILSLQLAPTLVHRNYVSDSNEKNDVFAIAAGGRVKISKRISINGDYIYRLSNTKNNTYYNSISLGVDIETGGHVFQLHITNSQGMIEQYFVAATDGNWTKGDIYYGFNISRQFNLKRKRKAE